MATGPRRKAELFRKVDGAVDVAAIEKLVAERKLTSEGMDPNSVMRNSRTDGTRAGAPPSAPFHRRLFPRGVCICSAAAFPSGRRAGSRSRASPAILKERDRLIGRGDPVLDRYARVTFEKTLINGQPQAELLAPGHPLARCRRRRRSWNASSRCSARAACWSTRRTRATSRACSSISNTRSATGASRSPGEPRAISQRLQFIHLKEDGSATDAGPAPYLDYRPDRRRGEGALVGDATAAPWLAGHVEQRALGYAIANARARSISTR